MAVANRVILGALVPTGPLLTFRPSGGAADIPATPCRLERQGSTLSTKGAFRKKWPSSYTAISRIFAVTGPGQPRQCEDADTPD